MSPRSPLPTPTPQGKPPAWPMIRAVVGVAVLCSLAIVLVYEWTRPVIRRNRIEMLEQAIVTVLPGATSSATFQLNDDGSFTAVRSDHEGDDLVYAGYNDGHELVGLAIVAQGMGYQDVIRLLYGYSFETEAILGISVLESRETPGLGDRIESDPDFLANFGELDVRLNPAGTALAHPIEFVKPGGKSAKWQLDGISGATITSQATAAMLRDSAEHWIHRVRARRADFLVPADQP